MTYNFRRGLKLLRNQSGYNDIDPNVYWGRQPRKRCPKCGYRVRGSNHENGSHHLRK